MGKQIVDQSMQMNVRQFLVTGRKVICEGEQLPETFAMRVFAKNEVFAKSNFWYEMKRQNKLKKANGQILQVSEIFEKNQKSIKTYGIVCKYRCRTQMINMYKEFRDISVNGAVSQLYAELSGNHRANGNTVHVLRVAVLHKNQDIKRVKSHQFRDSKIKFPIVKTLPKASQDKYRSVFKASRPACFKS